jgi:predicted molibdopterin-dependent oxidoreductase YjgC
LAAKVKLLGAHTHTSPSDALYAVDLPRAHYAEQDGSFTNVQGKVQAVRKALEPLGESQSAWMLAFYVAEALGHRAPAMDAAGIAALRGGAQVGA